MLEQFPKDPRSEQSKISRLKEAMYSRAISGKFRMRQRRSLDPIPATVPTDFEVKLDPVGGKQIAPRAIGAARKTLWWMLGIAVLFFMAALGVFLYYFFVGPGSQIAAPGNVDIAIRGPVNVSGGEPAEFQVIVSNRNQAPLELADLIIKYPPGTRSPTDLTSDLSSQRISLGTIPPGGRRQGTVKAIMVGTEGAKVPVHAEVEYRVANSSAIFVSSADYTVAFNASPVTVAVDANTEAISGQPFVVTATVSSNGAASVKDVLLKVEYPFGFKVLSTDPDVDTAGFWELGDMNPGETRTVKIRGQLVGEAQDDKVFTLAVGTRRDGKAQKIEVPLSQTMHHVSIAKPFIGLNIAVSKQSNGDPDTFLPGDLVNVAVSYKNNLSTGIDDAILVATLKGISISGTSVHTTDGFYRSSDKTVLWDRDTTNNALQHLEPGEQGVVQFSFQIPDNKQLSSVADPSFSVAVHAAGRRVDQTGVPETLQSIASTTVHIASNVEFLAQGFYRQNPFGSTGPLPPQVDQETTYAIVWALSNSSNTIKNGKVTAKLPSYVRWVGIHSPGSEKLSFNAANGTLTWDVGTIEKGVGVNGTLPRRVAFAVGLTPSASQIGQQPALIRGMRFTAVDSFAEVPIVRTAGDVNTNIVNDQGFSTTESSVIP